jgi:hypothetical protein
MSSPGIPTGNIDESTPLLGSSVVFPRRRGLWRSIFCGEVEEGDEDTGWGAGWRRFWNPVGRGVYWKGLIHLWLLNFPFVSAEVVISSMILRG